jgi:hypothetical protein
MLVYHQIGAGKTCAAISVAEKMKKNYRNNWRKQIEEYLMNDCIYLFDIVKAFLTNYGFKISIGQAAMHLLKKEYPQCKNVHSLDDEFLRNFFYGGRVECLAGAGLFEGEYKLYDVNSMYPHVMAKFQHPVSNRYTPRKGKPGPKTTFIDLQCFSKGAFPTRVEGEGTLFPHEYGRYKISIHEYNMAKKLKLVSCEAINYVVDCEEFTNFERFVNPLYSSRIATKTKLARLESEYQENSQDYMETKKDDIFLKLILNNAYGKFAQNPRRFKEFYLTDWDEKPGEETETWRPLMPHKSSVLQFYL